MFISAFVVGASLWGMVVLLAGGLAWPWKTFAVGIVVVALAMQFIPVLHVHFLIPFLLHIVVGLWGSLYLLWPSDI
jgi:hypothetical protein